MELAVHQREIDDLLIIGLKGKITIGSGDVMLRDTMEQAAKSGHKKVILDMDGVKYVDSSGIGELVNVATMLKEAGVSLRLARLNNKVFSLLQLTSLVSSFAIYDSLEDAMQG